MTEGIEETGAVPEGQGPRPYLQGFAAHAAEAVRLQRVAQNSQGPGYERESARAEALTEATLAVAYANAAAAARQG